MSLDQVTPRLNTPELLAELRSRGYCKSRTTLDKWIGLGLPSHQISGPRGTRTFDLDAVLSWLDSRWSLHMGQAPTEGAA